MGPTYSCTIQILVTGPPETNIEPLLRDVLEEPLPVPALYESLHLLPLGGELLDEEE